MNSDSRRDFPKTSAAVGAALAASATATADANTPPFVYTGLKREQLLRTGSMVLHELYFAGLGGNGQAGSVIRSRIAASLSTRGSPT